jgi:hypothetical protein
MGRSYRARIIGAAASRVRGVIEFVELGRRRHACRHGRIQRAGLVGVGGGHGHPGKRGLDG